MPTDNIEEYEEKLGIKPGVEKEWGPTFDKLLEYHNMPNDSLKDTIRFIFTCKENCKQLRKENEILVTEMKNWMKPPLSLKKYLCKEKYEEDFAKYNTEVDALFGAKDSIEKLSISKEKLFNGIINELRKGNKQVKLLCPFRALNFFIRVILQMVKFIIFMQ